jgi:hypothetical protein
MSVDILNSRQEFQTMTTTQTNAAIKLMNIQAKAQVKLVKAQEKAQAKLLKAQEKANTQALRAQLRYEAKLAKEHERATTRAARAEARIEARMLKEREIKEAKAARVEARAHNTRERFSRAINTGFKAMEKYPEGCSMKQLANVYIETYGLVNIWDGKESDYESVYNGIRSHILEMSPSSCQHWYKWGKRRLAGEVAPWHFYNKELALMNQEFGWSKITIGKGRAWNHGLWFFAPILRRDTWSEALYGPLPTEEELDRAQADRRIGVRNHNVN